MTGYNATRYGLQALMPRQLRVSRHLGRPPRFTFTTETMFQLTSDTYLEPDSVFWDDAGGIVGLKADTAHFVVEIADSSYSYDIGRKAALYASFGIPELWVIHAVRRERRIHRKPSLTGYQSTIDLASDQPARSGLRAGACGHARRTRTELEEAHPARFSPNAYCAAASLGTGGRSSLASSAVSAPSSIIPASLRRASSASR